MTRNQMLIYNNQRKMCGLPLHRKRDKKKENVREMRQTNAYVHLSRG